MLPKAERFLSQLTSKIIPRSVIAPHPVFDPALLKPPLNAIHCRYQRLSNPDEYRNSAGKDAKKKRHTESRPHHRFLSIEYSFTAAIIARQMPSNKIAPISTSSIGSIGIIAAHIRAARRACSAIPR